MRESSGVASSRSGIGSQLGSSYNSQGDKFSNFYFRAGESRYYVRATSLGLLVYANFFKTSTLKVCYRSDSDFSGGNMPGYKESTLRSSLAEAALLVPRFFPKVTSVEPLELPRPPRSVRKSRTFTPMKRLVASNLQALFTDSESTNTLFVLRTIATPLETSRRVGRFGTTEYGLDALGPYKRITRKRLLFGKPLPPKTVRVSFEEWVHRFPGAPETLHHLVCESLVDAIIALRRQGSG